MFFFEIRGDNFLSEKTELLGRTVFLGFVGFLQVFTNIEIGMKTSAIELGVNWLIIESK